MKSSFRIFFPILFLVSYQVSFSQKAKPVYHPCFLMDSVETKLSFIQLNASRIFIDTVDCKQNVLDNIALLYVKSKEKKYLDALSAIHENPKAKVSELYTDLIKRFAENDFAGFINDIYLAKGKYFALEKELIATMNMIVGTKPMKQKYLGLLNIEIGKAKDKKNGQKAYFLEKLKTKIEDEKY